MGGLPQRDTEWVQGAPACSSCAERSPSAKPHHVLQSSFSHFRRPERSIDAILCTVSVSSHHFNPRERLTLAWLTGPRHSGCFRPRTLKVCILEAPPFPQRLWHPRVSASLSFSFFSPDLTFHRLNQNSLAPTLACSILSSLPFEVSVAPATCISSR